MVSPASLDLSVTICSSSALYDVYPRSRTIPVLCVQSALVAFTFEYISILFFSVYFVASRNGMQCRRKAFELIRSKFYDYNANVLNINRKNTAVKTKRLSSLG